MRHTYVRTNSLARSVASRRSKPATGRRSYSSLGYIDSKGGGCAKASAAKQWILVTNKRILFEASVKEGSGETGTFQHQSGSIPMAKVSYVGTSTTQKTEGCSSVNVTNLTINSSGGSIVLAIPTKQEADRAREVIDAVLSQSA